jgi:hypothetical protein
MSKDDRRRRRAASERLSLNTTASSSPPSSSAERNTTSPQPAQDIVVQNYRTPSQNKDVSGYHSLIFNSEAKSSSLVMYPMPTEMKEDHFVCTLIEREGT